jgi:type IV pilus assembly protein PilP
MTIAFLVAATGPAVAQAPPAGQAVPPKPHATPSQPAPGAQAPAPGAQAPAVEPYTYDPAGRRDPFISLVARGADPLPAGKRSEGLAGLTTAEIAVKGVLQSQGTYVAVVAGPDARTFIVHVNDRLLDGTVKTITPQGLVIVQEVNDPLSLVKQREVNKGLRASEDPK